MGKKGKKTYKGFTYKTLLILLFVGTNVKPNQENPCLWLIIQLLIGDPMVCGYLTAQMILTTLCVIWKAIDTTMERYYDKGLLEWFDGGLVPPRPRIVLDKQSGPEKMEHLETCCKHQSTEELGTWTGHFIGTSRGHSNYFFRYNQSYFIQACVPLPFVIAIENLQFNKTFMFCNLY